MVSYGEAIKRPFTSFKSLLIGSALSLVPIVNLMVTGYALRCAKAAATKDYEIPEWERFGNLFVKGVLAAVISIIMLLPAVMLVIATFMLITAFKLGILVGWTVAIPALIVLLVTIYILPLAMTRFAVEGYFTAAFHIGTLFRKAFTGKYFLTWLAVVGWNIVLVAASMLLSLLLVITIIGPYIVMVVLTFVVSVTSFTMYGDAYGELE